MYLVMLLLKSIPYFKQKNEVGKEIATKDNAEQKLAFLGGIVEMKFAALLFWLHPLQIISSLK